MKSGPDGWGGHGRSSCCDLARTLVLGREGDCEQSQLRWCEPGTGARPAWCLVCESMSRKTQSQGVSHGLRGLREIHLEALRRHGREEVHWLPRVIGRSAWNQKMPYTPAWIYSH